MKLIVSVSFCFLQTLNLLSQTQSSFFVFSLKGSGYYTRDKYLIPLKIGSALSSNDIITLDPQSEIKILCNSYSIFPLTSKAKKINFPIKNYIDKCSEKEASISLNVLKYIWNQLSTHELQIEKNKNEFLKEFGGSIRGCADSIFNSLPDTILLFKNVISINYSPKDTSGKYSLNIYSSPDIGIPLAQMPLTNFHFTISPNKLKELKPDQIYYYAILKNGQEYCERKIIGFISQNSFDLISSEFQQTNDFKNLQSADQKFTMGFFLEMAHLPAESYWYYKKGGAENPKNKFFEHNSALLKLNFDFQEY